MRIRSKKFVLLAILLIIVIATVFVGFSGNDEATTLVQTDLVVRDDISEVVTASGRVQPQTAVDITAEISAEIIDIYVKEGDRVERGQLLMMLDTIQTRSDLTQARYSLDEIRARAGAAASQYRKDSLEFARQKRLFQRDLASESDYVDAQFAFENSRANFKAMRAQVRTLEAKLEKAADALSKTQIVSPMKGVVTYLGAEVGEIAQAQTSFTQGKTLMTIGDLSVFEVEVNVDETEIAKVALGHPADIRVDAFRDTSFEGTVIEIGNSATVEGEGTENFATTFKVKVRFDKQNPRVRPGMSATVDITTAKDEDAVLVPYAAVVTREVNADSVFSTQSTERAHSDAESDGALVRSVRAAEDDEGNGSSKPGEEAEKIKQSGVFLYRGGKSEFLPITTGIADDRNIVALSGVQRGDTVISGSFKTLRQLRHGDVVEIESHSLTGSGD